MPNIICSELVMKNGKVDIVEQEVSKLWNEKIQRLEDENKKLKEENEELKEEAEQNKQLFDTTFGEFMKLKEENTTITEENQGYVATIHEMEKEIKKLQEVATNYYRLEKHVAMTLM